MGLHEMPGSVSLPEMLNTTNSAKLGARTMGRSKTAMVAVVVVARSRVW